MDMRTADDIARELFRTRSEREAHTHTLQALLARNATMQTNDALINTKTQEDDRRRE